MTDPAANEHPDPEPAPPSAPDHGLNPTEPVPVGGPAPTPPMPANPSPPRRGRNIGDAILVVAVVATIAAIGFAAGRLTAPTPATGRVSTVVPNRGFGGGVFGNGGPGQGGYGNGGQGGLGRGSVGQGLGGVAIQGKVTEVAPDHLTVTLVSGRTAQIPVDSSTQYQRQSGSSASGVTAGDQVQIRLAGRRGANAGQNGSGGRTLPVAISVTILGQ